MIPLIIISHCESLIRSVLIYSAILTGVTNCGGGPIWASLHCLEPQLRQVITKNSPKIRRYVKNKNIKSYGIISPKLSITLPHGTPTELSSDKFL